LSVYTDQIWTKSQCRELEIQALRQLRHAGGNPLLVDAVNTAQAWSNLVTDNIVQLDHIPLYPEYWGTYSYQSEYIDRAPTRLFNCFMNRICTTRQSWFYQFVRRNLLHFGNVSFLLDSRNLPRGKELYDANYIGYEIFEVEHELMQDQVPFVNFEGDLDQAVIDSQFSVVIETYFDWPDTIAFSEKVFRALQLPRPILLYSMPGSVKALRDYGFELFDDIVDHSYDTEPDQIKRQVMILDQLCAWRDRTFTNQQVVDFEKRSKHNLNLLQDFRNQWPSRLNAVLEYLNK
jgi:hypothetical protein